MVHVPPQLPPFGNAIRAARIALLAYVFFVPSVAAHFADAPSESTWLLPSPRKVLILALVAYQMHALLTALSRPPRTFMSQEVGGVIHALLAVLMGLPLMHLVHGATTGWLADAPPAVWLFDRTVPFAEFALLSPMDVAQAPAHALFAAAVDLVVIAVVGGTGYDVVVDGQRRRVIHGWLRRSTPYAEIVGLVRREVEHRTTSGRWRFFTHRTAIVRRSGAPIELAGDESSDPAFPDALAEATGLPRGEGPRAPAP
jgi:hypothetical protein